MLRTFMISATPRIFYTTVAGLVVGGGAIAGLLVSNYGDAITYALGGPLGVKFKIIGPDNAKMIDERSLTVINLLVPDEKPEEAPKEPVEHLFEFRFIEGGVDPYKCCYSSGGYHWCTTVQALPCPPA